VQDKGRLDHQISEKEDNNQVKYSDRDEDCNVFISLRVSSSFLDSTYKAKDS